MRAESCTQRAANGEPRTAVGLRGEMAPRGGPQTAQEEKQAFPPEAKVVPGGGTRVANHLRALDAIERPSTCPRTPPITNQEITQPIVSLNVCWGLHRHLKRSCCMRRQLRQGQSVGTKLGAFRQHPPEVRVHAVVRSWICE